MIIPISSHGSDPRRYLSELPEDLLFNIADYYGDRIPELTDEYILQEIMSLDVSYDDISTRAEQLGLPNLLKYITTPFNIDRVVSVTNLRYGNIPGSMENTYDVCDWGEFIQSMFHRRVEVAHSPEASIVIRDIPRALVHDVLNVATRTSPSQDISIRSGDIYIRVNPEQLSSFLVQVYASSPEVNILGPCHSTLKIHPEITGSIQDQLVQSLNTSRYSGNDILSVLEYADIMYYLRQARVKRDIIDSILNYTQPTEIHGIKINMDELKVLDMLVSSERSVTIRMTEARDMFMIVTDGLNAEEVEIIQDLLLRNERYEDVSISYQRNTFCVIVTSRSPVYSVDRTIMDGDLNVFTDIRRLAHVMITLHNPLNTSRTTIHEGRISLF
uniref:Uncharacterized protein n=1 Tax=viral metagenome TaxID=1070528 RepID=A0A6C0BP60_9ZZZZ